jgi:hypothetical protein
VILNSVLGNAHDLTDTGMVKFGMMRESENKLLLSREFPYRTL